MGAADTAECLRFGYPRVFIGGNMRMGSRLGGPPGVWSGIAGFSIPGLKSETWGTREAGWNGGLYEQN